MKLSDELIRKLAAAMVTPTAVSSRTIHAGQTYLGQMISHDIVPPTHRGPHSRKAISPTLNLDSIYGENPGDSSLFDGNGLFHLSRRAPTYDLWRRRDGTAVIPEPRNDDNVIIAQMHQFWQRCHNTLIRSGYARDAEQARSLVILAFQLIVVEDFLSTMLNDKVHRAYFRKHHSYLGFKSDPLPGEFTHAAFRFGHSLVRSFYQLQGDPNDPDRPTQDLVKLLRPHREIPDEMAIDWSLMFACGVEDRVQFAHSLDPQIEESMSEIPDLESRSIKINITIANLEAGNAADFPSGWDYVNNLLNSQQGRKLQKEFGLNPLADLGEGAIRFVEGISIRNLPLWPYFLLEASMQEHGENLGILGSLICAEVLQNAVKKADVSIYQNDKYDFCLVMQRMGQLGEDLESFLGAKRRKEKRDHNICMSDLLEFINQRE